MPSDRRIRTAGCRTGVILATLLLACLPACHDSDDDIFGPAPPYTLKFSLDSTFQAPHGGDSVYWSLVLRSNGFAADFGNGVVSDNANPAFSFTTAAVMQQGVDYEVHYWIDSNIGGGTLGVCDVETIDHQWSMELPSVSNDKDITVSHNPALVENVCSSFLP